MYQDSTPYIGGSTNGSIWNLIFGYDGFGRLTGNGGPGGGSPFGGSAGILRILNAEVGGQVAWLIPLAALVFLAVLHGDLPRELPTTVSGLPTAEEPGKIDLTVRAAQIPGMRRAALRVVGSRHTW